ncbi:MAG TPA: low specificity L-threonine aldolase [Candidatus Udaeobacter sp.]|jgi:threonine aldolase|nr:low specificity L-threonine aldolase [Candidatus Udaeobacter sp.]
MTVDRQDFASDNTASICPEAWSALQEANMNYAAAYGEDRWTATLCDRIREIFETDCDVYLVFTGTAANALALAQICRSFRSVICHQNAHIQTDECGASEFFTSGSKLLLVGGATGKIDIGQTRALLTRHNDLHSHKPGAISVAQSTEFGTVYTRDEIAAIAALARSNDLFLHLDGARFANAVASLNCAPRSITWDIGVDVLCFGGTKNGTAAGELVIFFNRSISREFDYRLKQAGQLGSKMRFLAAQWLGLLSAETWLRNARHADRMARQLAEKLQRKANLEVVFPVEANAVFVRMDDRLVRGLHASGWHFYKFIEPDIYRLMCSWATTEGGIDDFVRDVSRNH